MLWRNSIRKELYCHAYDVEKRIHKKRFAKYRTRKYDVFIDSKRKRFCFKKKGFADINVFASDFCYSMKKQGYRPLADVKLEEHNYFNSI